MASPLPLQNVAVKGLKVAYRRTGSGPTVFLQHGGAGSGIYWKDVMPGLADMFDVVAWDMVGYGGSEVPPPSFSFSAPDLAEYLVGFMDALGVDEAFLAGQSAGGLVTACAAATYPRRARAVALLTVPNVSERPTYVHKLAEQCTGADGITRITLDFMRREMHADATQAEVDDWNTNRLGPAGTSFARVVKGIRNFKTLDIARQVQAPTLVIWGAKTSHRPPTDATLLRDALPKGRMAIIDGAEVAVPMDAAAEVVRLLTDFFPAKGSNV